ITINGAQPPFSFAPTENGTREMAITFNVSDDNGQGDIVDSSVVAILNFTGTTKTNTSACTVITTGTNDKYYNCSLIFEYFDENSTLYGLNVTATDVASQRATNFTQAAFTFTVLTAIELTLGNLTFSGNAGQNNTRETNQMLVRNTGNDVFRELNITAFDLNGINQVIGVTNFTVNFTNSTQGALFLGTSFASNGSTVRFTNTSAGILQRVNNSNKTLSFSVNLSASLNELSYNASRYWNITASRALGIVT
ncbi:hypothetical protein HY484_04015, partial [Candidatus Woesearchaeota archaeon]|nr:hypothetical protein [Candidatus Woesearchaeota archaeon]